MKAVNDSGKRKAQQGKITVEFGEWLTQQVSDRSHRLEVFFDHGPHHNENVATIKGFVSPLTAPHATRENTLCQVDLAIVDHRSGHVQLLIEVEERYCSPKKILGDVFSALMCNWFEVGPKGHYPALRPTSKTKLLVFCVRKSSQKLEIMETQLRKLSPIADCIDPKNVCLKSVSAPDDLLSALKHESNTIIDRIRSELSQG